MYICYWVSPNKRWWNQIWHNDDHEPNEALGWIKCYWMVPGTFDPSV